MIRIHLRPASFPGCLALICAINLSIAACCQISRAADITIERGDDKATVKIDGELFTEYLFQGHPKPILYPIIGPHGIPMTRNYPMKKDVKNEAHDHPHHESLWYSHDGVNGENFWSSHPESRREGPKASVVQESLTVDGDSIRADNQWLGAKGQLVCKDTRVLTFGTTSVGRYIDYQITIQAPNEDVVFADTKEGTMAIRTNPLLRIKSDPKRGNETARGKSINSEGVEGVDMWGKRAKWVDYWAPIEGHTVGVAIFDHPSNPRHPTWWHARYYGLVAANPFGIHDFEKKAEGIGEMVIKKGSSVTFRYRFLFHEGDADSADIENQFAEFAN